VLLLLSYLERGENILDVGCGIGAYAEPLIAAGMKWEGCEKRSDYCEQLEARGLPCRVVVDELPFESGSFDAAIAIEVVEHVVDAAAFVSEVARVARRAAYFSVPNMAVLPMYWTYYAIPWHMLIPDHENFFTRFSLKSLLQPYFRAVEIIEYGRIPSLDSKEGLPLYNHLFAIAQH
jgi:2-polyprenyl-3-methyl-5-hydroxy-6-metoxy-1,4-benzoquinol methylase